MNNANAKSNTFWLFLGTFVSAFLLFAGVAGVLLMLAPTIVGVIQSGPINTPKLPIALDRDGGFLEVGPNAGKQPFPALPHVENVESGNWIRIPSIGVNVPLVMSASLRDEDVLNTLDKGAALYPNGIEPGRLGNAFISAHSTEVPWKGKYRFAFLKINELQAGNVVHLDYEGTRYTYRVTDKDVIVPTPEYRVVSDRPVPTLTVMACWPLWTSDKRMLVQNELVNVTKLTPRPV